MNDVYEMSSLYNSILTYIPQTIVPWSYTHTCDKHTINVRKKLKSNELNDEMKRDR